MANELVIEIKGSAKEFLAALDEVKKSTSKLEDQLGNIAKISGVAFALSTAEILMASKAYGDHEAAVKKVTQALQQQGIYSDELSEKYQEQAEQIEKLTGIDADQVLAGQAVLQQMIGQTEISDELTQATVDLAAKMGGDLNGAFELVGRAVNGHTRGLVQMGLTIDENVSQSERLDQITSQLTQTFGGQAETAAEGFNGSIKSLSTSFELAQKKIGEAFAPAIEFAARAMTAFFNGFADNEELVDFGISVLAGVAAASGLALAASGAGLAIIKFKEAMELAKVATEAMGIATKGLVAATGIGLLVILLTEIYMHWDAIWPAMQATFHAFVNNISSLGSGLASLLMGVFSFDKAKIQQGLNDVKESLSKGFSDYSKMSADYRNKEKSETERAGQEQGEIQKELADKAEAERQARDQRKLEALKAQNELLVMEAEEDSKATIALKKEEADILAKIDDDKYKSVREQLKESLEEKRAELAEAQALELEQQENFNNEILANNQQFQALSVKDQTLLYSKEQQALQASIQTQRSTQLLYAKQKLTEQIAANNQFLMDQQRYGTAYATINKAMHSEVMQGSKQAFGELQGLTQSHNETLKAIGKAASIASIIIKTSESAMNIFAGFSSIPFVGPALGIAGAAAAVAFGAEQIGTVTAAAQGGLITGGIPGFDSVPSLLMPGELVVPSRNYEEVVGSVAGSRSGGGSGGNMGVTIGFDGREASQVLTVRQNEDRSLGTSRQSS